MAEVDVTPSHVTIHFSFCCAGFLTCLCRDTLTIPLADIESVSLHNHSELGRDRVLYIWEVYNVNANSDIIKLL